MDRRRAQMAMASVMMAAVSLVVFLALHRSADLLADFLLDGHIEAFARVESFGLAASELLLVPGFLVVPGPVVREAAAEHARRRLNSGTKLLYVYSTNCSYYYYLDH